MSETGAQQVKNRAPKNSSGQPIGKTSSGTKFSVPESHDMIHTLLDPRLPKSLVDYATVVILLSYVAFWAVLPSNWRKPVFFLMFAFWRCAYNLGIGHLLKVQSAKEQLVHWAKVYRLFERDSKYYQFVAHDLGRRLPGLKAAEIEQLPIEYKTWIVFRHFVDLILMSDFVTYCLLALGCFHHTAHPWYIVLGRWSAGLILILFNLWVKIDAHRVVKDFAWYWGDFFFLEDANLVFDGVFEMAPHPMYSIGYAAYYGLSLITASFTLFLASVLAHALQFYFLVTVETPHIDKTYGGANAESASRKAQNPINHDFERPTPRAMLLLSNFNFTRTSDIALVALVYSTLLLAFPKGWGVTLLVLLLALTWRLVHTLGLGILLRRQSSNQHWTRLCLKYGATPLEAYQKWQAMYNITTVMSYTSLLVLAVREISSPFRVSFWIFRYILGSMLVVLQVWTSYSVYEQLGDYGWFFGDFFYVKETMNLTVSGIYRYLNHPDRIFGIAGVIGLAAICCSSVVTFVMFFWLFSNLAFLQFVEKPHVRKLYGDHATRDAGVKKNIRKMQAIFQNTVLDPDYVETRLYDLYTMLLAPYAERLAQLRPRAEGVVADTRRVLNQYPAAATKILRDDMSSADLEGYTLKVHKSEFDIGEPIKVEWTSGAKFERTARDWIGIYALGANGDAKITSRSSTGRWSGIESDQFPTQRAALECGKRSGWVEFSGRLLFWAPGRYEFRYHRNAKHNVLCISAPFEIRAEQVDPLGREGEIAASVLNLYERASAKGKPDPEEEAGVLGLSSPLDLDNDEVLARLTECIRAVYGVDLAPFVVHTEGTATRIALRIKNVASALSALRAVEGGRESEREGQGEGQGENKN